MTPDNRSEGDEMAEIIVGVDGSEGSRTALRWAARIAAAKGTAIRAVGAWQYPARAVIPGSPKLTAPDDMDQATCDDVRAVVREELDAGAGRVEVEAGRGPAAPVLLGAAARTGADMLVLGARGLGGFAGLLLGSVSQECVEHSPCPVVVLRDGHDRLDGPIVVGLDGSDGSTRALDWTIGLAEATDSHIVAVHAPGIGANNATVEAARQSLEEWCAPIAHRGLTHEIRVESGDARTALEAAADATDASLLVVGTRGLGALRGLLLGSVAGYVVRYATRPVAVVPLDRSTV
jgi:nucleotide-binding universal stress UspA family protein